MHRLLLQLRDLLYPGFCQSCACRIEVVQNDFCQACEQLLGSDPHLTCPRCSSSVGAYVDLQDGCAKCRGEVFAFRATLRMGPYHGPLRELILRAKQSNGRAVAEALALLWADRMAERLLAYTPSIVIPVPLHWRRRWQRGFNQSRIFADSLAARMGIPCRTGMLQRHRFTPPQTEQTPSGRRENVRDAFMARKVPELNQATIVLVDDVLTTGSTAHAASRALREAGAAEIIVAVVGHG